MRRMDEGVRLPDCACGARDWTIMNFGMFPGVFFLCTSCGMAVPEKHLLFTANVTPETEAVSNATFARFFTEPLLQPDNTD